MNLLTVKKSYRRYRTSKNRRLASLAKICNKTIILYVVFALVLSPYSIAVETTIIVDRTALSSEQPALDIAQNGVEIVNITRPSKAGVSKNSFKQYSVSKSGVILNNSLEISNSQLGGTLYANPFFEETSADIVLFEVNGNEITHLDGFTEMHGNNAEFVLANPNGIQVNGGGFINTPRATMTTGYLELNPLGQLDKVIVDSGDIIIGEEGLDGSRLDELNILSRGIEVKGDIWGGQNLRVESGVNIIDYEDTESIEQIRGPSSEKKLWGINQSEKARIIANNIDLISTEIDAGIKADGELVGFNTVSLSSEGNIRYSSIKSNGNVGIHSRKNVEQTKELLAGKVLAISGESVAIKGESVISREEILFDASKKMEFDGEGSDEGLLIYSENSPVEIKADSVEIANKTYLYSPKSVGISAKEAIQINQSQIESEKNVELRAGGEIQNNGEVISKGKVLINTQKTFRNDEKIEGGTAVSVISDYFENTGLVLSDSDLDIISQKGGQNLKGNIYSGSDLRINMGGDFENNKALIKSGESIQINSTLGSVLNKGTIQAEKEVFLGANKKVLNSEKGLILSNQKLKMTAKTGALTNEDSSLISSKGPIELFAKEKIVNQKATVESGGRIDLVSQSGTIELSEGSLIQSGEELNLEANSDVLVDHSRLYSEKTTRITAQNFLHDKNSLTTSLGGLRFKLDGLFFNDGRVESVGDLDIRGRQKVSLKKVENHGDLLSLDDIFVQANFVDNTNTKKGLGMSANDLIFQIGSGGVDNRHGKISTKQELSINSGGDIKNEHGSLESESYLTIFSEAKSIINNRGRIAAKKKGRLVAGVIKNENTLDPDDQTLGIQTQGDLEVVSTAGHVDNEFGQISTEGVLKIQSETSIDNNLGMIESSYQGNLVSKVSAKEEIQNEQGKIKVAGNLEMGATYIEVLGNTAKLFIGGTPNLGQSNLIVDGGSVFVNDKLRVSATPLKSPVYTVKNATIESIDGIELNNITLNDQGNSVFKSFGGGSNIEFVDIRYHSSSDDQTPGKILSNGNVFIRLVGDHSWMRSDIQAKNNVYFAQEKDLYIDNNTNFLSGANMDFRVDGKVEIENDIQAGGDLAIVGQSITVGRDQEAAIIANGKLSFSTEDNRAAENQLFNGRKGTLSSKEELEIQTNFKNGGIVYAGGLVGNSKTFKNTGLVYVNGDVFLSDKGHRMKLFWNNGRLEGDQIMVKADIFYNEASFVEKIRKNKFFLNKKYHEKEVDRGKIISQGNFNIEAGSVSNYSGEILSGNDLTIYSDSGVVNTNKGNIYDIKFNWLGIPIRKEAIYPASMHAKNILKGDVAALENGSTIASNKTIEKTKSKGSLTSVVYGLLSLFKENPSKFEKAYNIAENLIVGERKTVQLGTRFGLGNIDEEGDVLRHENDSFEMSFAASEFMDANGVKGAKRIENIGELFQTKIHSYYPKITYKKVVDPRLLDKDRFLGSDYFLKRMGVKEDTEITLYGDSFYETQWIKDQIIDQTGRQYLNENVQSYRDQIQILYDNAVEVQKKLGLQLGESLNQDQIAGLQKDIVWLEKKLVRNELIWVPTVYLSQLTLKDIERDSGSIISAGQDIALVVNGDLNNRGVIQVGYRQSEEGRNQASNSVEPDTTQLEENEALVVKGILNNEGKIIGLKQFDFKAEKVINSGEISGRSIQAETQKDFVNKGIVDANSLKIRAGQDFWNQGVITGENVGVRADRKLKTKGSSILHASDQLSLSSGGDLNWIKDIKGRVLAENDLFLTSDQSINLISQKVEKGDENNRKEKIREKAKVYAGGNLRLEAGKDIQARGATLLAGNDLSLKAKRNVNLEYLRLKEVETKETKKSKRSWGRKSHTTTTVRTEKDILQGTIVKAGGNLTVESGEDTSIEAGDLRAHKMAIFKVGGDFNLVAGFEEVNERKDERKRGGWGGSRDKTYQTQQKKVVGSQLKAEDFYVQSGGNAQVLGSQIKSSGVGVIESGGDTRIGAAQETGEYYSKRTQSSFVGNSSVVDRESKVSHAKSNIEARKGLQVQSKGHIFVEGSSVGTNGAALLQADKNIVVISKEDKKQFSREKKKNTLGLYKGSDQDQLSQTKQQSSDLNSGSELVFDSGESIWIEGSNLNAEDDMRLKAEKDILISSAEEVTQKVNQKEASHFAGLSTSKTRSSVSVGISQSKSRTRRESLKINQKKSRIKTGGKIIAESGRDTTIAASDLVAGGDVVIAAKRNLKITAKEAIQEESLKRFHGKKTIGVTVGNAWVETAYQAKDSVENPEAGLKAAETVEAVSKSAVTAGTLGFYTGASVSQKNHKSHSKNEDQQDIGSILKSRSGSIYLTSQNNLDVYGSDLISNKGDIELQGEFVRIAAGKRRGESQSSYQESQTKASITSAGIDIPTRTSSKGGGNSQYTFYQNSNLSAKNGTVKISSQKDAELIGVNSVSKILDLDVGRKLTTSSLQDTLNSNEKSQLVTLGKSMGYSEESGKQERAWVTHQTSLVGTEKVTLKATELNNTGAVVANITEDGRDGQNLNIQVEKMTAQHLKDKNYEKESGGGLEFSSLDYKRGSTKITVKSAGQDSQQLTRATIGKGLVTVEEKGEENTIKVNRDIAKAQELTKDKKKLTIDIDMNLSNKYALNPKESLSKDVKTLRELPSSTKQAGENVSKALSNLKKSVNDYLSSNKKDTLKTDYQGRIRNQELGLQTKINTQLNDSLENVHKDPTKAESELEKVANQSLKANGLMGDVDISFYNAKDGKMGAHKDGKIYINLAYQDGKKETVMTVLGDELSHYNDYLKGRPFDEKRQAISSHYGKDAKRQIESYIGSEKANPKEFQSKIGALDFSDVNKKVSETDDLEPLSIFIHGTYSKPENADPQFVKAVGDTFKEEVVQFKWSGKLNESERRKAGKKLAEFVNNYQFEEGEKLNVVGHSHGANVGKEWTQYYNGKKKVDNFIMMGAPQMKEHALNKDVMEKDAAIINIYDKKDWVQKVGSGRLIGGREMEGAKNIPIYQTKRVKTEIGGTDPDDVFLPMTIEQEVHIGPVESHRNLDSAEVWDQYVVPQLKGVKN